MVIAVDHSLISSLLCMNAQQMSIRAGVRMVECVTFCELLRCFNRSTDNILYGLSYITQHGFRYFFSSHSAVKVT